MQRVGKKSKIKGNFILFLLILFLASAGVTAASHLKLTEKYGDGIPIQEAANTSSGGLYSPYAILIRMDDSKVLMAKNSEERIYPASLTKIMTAIVAIENLHDLNKQITLDKGIFKSLQGEDASVAGFLPGEEVSAIDLLYGTMLPSGAECSLGLANAVAGSEKGFVKLMNSKAREIGMKDTNFKNATGLHDPGHYTTVKDLSIMLQYALKDKTFREIFTSSRHSIASTNKHPEGITIYNTMFKSMDSPSIGGGAIIGGKTGYTEQAGLCLASIAEKYGKQYILITAGARGDHNTKQYNILDAYAVYRGL